MFRRHITPTRRLATLIVALALELTAAPTATAQTSPAPETSEAAPTITVTPSTGLVDHQVVTVSGSGFRPNASISVQQCPPGRTEDFCEPFLAQVAPNGTGSFSVQVGVGVRAESFFGSEVDCRVAPGTCRVTAAGVGERAVAPLTFDPGAPDAPPPTATTAPSTGLVDGEVIDLTVNGLRAGAEMSVFQCVGLEPDLDAGDCDWYSLDTEIFQVGVDGVFATPVRVRAITRTGGPTADRVDCRTHPCSVMVIDDTETEFAAAGLTFDPDAPLLPRASIEVDPTTGLRGGDQVAVHGRDFFPGDQPGWTIVQCTLPVPGPLPATWSPRFACVEARSTRGTVEADGTFDGEVTVRAHFSSRRLGTVSCRVRQCGLVAVRDLRARRSDMAVVPLTFAPRPG